MSDLRIKYGVLEPGIEPFFCIELASSNITDEVMLLRIISKAIDLAVMLFNAKLVAVNDIIEPSVDEQYPVGACSFLFFNSHDDGIKFFNEILSALQ